jgi:hypothetical protein
LDSLYDPYYYFLLKFGKNYESGGHFSMVSFLLNFSQNLSTETVKKPENLKPGYFI